MGDPEQYESEAKGPVTDRLRAWSIALLFAALAANLFDHTIINILAQDIKVEFGLSDAKLGLLTGTATGAIFLFTALPLGYLVDRVNRIKLIAAAVAVWSLGTMGCGLAGTYIQLFIARLGVGIGGSALGPAGSSVVADLFPDKKRTSAMAVVLLGGSVGGFLGLLVGGYLASTLGWRMAFVIAGMPGLVLAVLMLLTMREPPRVTTNVLMENAATEALPFGATLKMLTGNSIFIGMVAASVCLQSMLFIANAWLPPFLIRAHHMSTVEAGGFAALALSLGGATGLMGAGVICDLLRPRIRHVEIKFLMTALAVSIPAILIAVLASGRALALPAMFVFSMCSGSGLPVTINIVQQAVGPYARGFAIALNTSMGACLGLGMGVPLVGLASDYLTPTYGENAIGYVLAGTSLIGVLAMIPLLIVSRLLSNAETVGKSGIGFGIA